jgi:hypothetical protein
MLNLQRQSKQKNLLCHHHLYQLETFYAKREEYTFFGGRFDIEIKL